MLPVLKFRKFYYREHAYRKFRKFYYRERPPSSYQNFRNFKTARFPYPTKFSEILVAGKNCSRYYLGKFSTARQARKRLSKGNAPKYEVPGARATRKKRRRIARHRFIREYFLFLDSSSYRNFTIYSIYIEYSTSFIFRNLFRILYSV